MDQKNIIPERVQEACRRLRIIADSIGPGKAYNQLVSRDTKEILVWFPVHRLMEILPPEYCLVAPGDTVRFKEVPVGFFNLFEQIEKGRVETPLAEIVAYLPLSFTGLISREERKRLVRIPLDLLIDCLYNPNAVDRAALPWERF